MNEEDFIELMKRPESDTLDYKVQLHDFSDRAGHLDFIKDVACLANTPREGSAYIVYGASYDPATGPELVGLHAQRDDAEFVRVISNGSIAPIPKIAYHAVRHGGRQFGVLEVKPTIAAPAMATRTFPGDFKPGVVWTRRSSSNVPANSEELVRLVKWFGGTAPDLEERFSDAWYHFLEAVHGFEPGRAYLLIAEPLPKGPATALKSLGLVPWLGVIDFDPDSEDAGLLAAAKESLELHRTILRVVKGDRPDLHLRASTAWFFAKGMRRLPGSLHAGTARDWVRAYGREVDQQIASLVRIASPNPVTCVVIWQGNRLGREIRETLEAIEKSAGDIAEFVFVTPDLHSVELVAEEHPSTIVEISLPNLASGISDYLRRMATSSPQRCALPSKSGAPHDVEAKDRLWIEEELELIHLDAGTFGEDSPEAFRKGHTITWRDLNLNHDCQRDVTPRLRRRVEEDLRTRRTTRVNLTHAPGAGGSTVARRVAWDLHAEFPCVALHTLNPEPTAARLAKLASLTEHSILLLIDGGEHKQSDIDLLYDLLRGQQTATVILQVSRQFALTSDARDKQRTFHLHAALTHNELDRFLAVYREGVPRRASTIAALREAVDPRARTAFYVGLTAYGKDFVGLRDYTERRLGGMTPVQRKILGFLALARHYGQQELPAQSFAGVVSLPRARKVCLEDYLAPIHLELLVETQEGLWRTSHELIGEEIIHQLLSPASDRGSGLWRQQLSTWAIEFAHFLRGDWQTAGEHLVNTAQRVFVFRDDSQLLGTEASATKKYSQIVEDIPTREGRLELLRVLPRVFPEEAHFHAHLGRFCGLNGLHKEASDAIDRAVALNEHDPLLHHMRGMIYRYRAQDLMRSRQATGLDEIVRLASTASEAFESSRGLSPESEHGYISEVQLLLRVLDYAARESGSSVDVFIYSPKAPPYLRECLERAEDLMDQLANHRRGEAPSNYEVDCESRLSQMYGDYGTARQGWENLLSRRDTDRPPVRRQIVWSFLRQSSGDWTKLKTKQAGRCVGLLEENLEEQPRDQASMRLWLRAVRHVEVPPSIEAAIEKVSYWKANSGSLDSCFYLFVLHSLLAIEGSQVAVGDAERALEECRSLARYRRDRLRSFEWLGVGDGIRQLRHQSELGEWKTGDEFYPRTDLLKRFSGIVRRIDAPQKGSIEIASGQTVFFVPVVAGVEVGRDENTEVTFYLGFSYDGLRARQVHRAQ